MRPRPTNLAFQAGYICPRCRLASQRRAISTTFLEKKAEGRQQWDQWADEIRRGKRQSMLTILESRGYVQQYTGGRRELDELMTKKRIGVYCGVDPTAPSLHIGHLLPLMALFWMHVHGFHTVSLLGGATSRIGDPTGRSKDRPEMTSTERKANIVSMHYQMKKLWTNMEATAARNGFNYEKYWHREIANNSTWWNKVPFVDVVKYLGKGLRLGEMLKRDTVKNKMDSGDGMNFAEFCYPIMQAWDWWYMYDTKNIQMQIGGSDQYGNIVAGVEAVKYMAKTHPDPDIRQAGGVEKLTTPFGLTVPLLTSSSGEKFGKSAGNAIWLDSNMTSYFDLYAFFVRTADADVERYLKLFTFMPENKIQGIMDQHKNNTSKRVAQHTLAFEFLHLVHGQENAEFARGQYEKQAASRNKASLSSLMSASDLHTAAHEGEPSAHDINGETSTTAKLDETPSHYSQDAFTPPLAPDNILSMNQDPGTRIRSKFTSPVLNPYAPVSNPNTASGSAAHIILPASLIRDQSIAKVLYSAGLVTSRSEGHRLAQGKGAYIGRRSSGHKQMTEEIDFVPVKLADPHLTWDSIIRDHEKTKLMDKKGEEGLLVLRNGKWKVRMIRVVSDEQFECLNLPDPPLWQEFKSQLARKRAEDGIDETKGWKGKRASDPEPTANDHEIAPAKASARTDLSQSTWTEPTARVQDRVASKQRYFQVGRAYDTLKQRERDERRLGPQQAHLPSQSRGLHTSSYPRGSDNDVDQAKASGAKPKLRKMPGEIHPAELRKRHAIKMSLLAQARFRGNQAVLNDMREDSKAARVAEAKRMERMSARAEWDEEDRLFRNAGKEPGAVDQTQRTECAANDTRVRKRAGKKTHAKRSVTDEELGREYFDKEGSEPGMKVKRLPDMDPKSEEYSALKRRYVDMQTHDDGQKIRDEVRAREQERDEATFMDVDGHGLHEAYAQQEYSRADDRLASTGSSKTKDDHNNKLSNWQKRSKYSMRENHPDAAEAMIKVQAERDWSRRRMERVRMSFESMRTKAARMQDAFGGRGWGDKGDS